MSRHYRRFRAWPVDSNGLPLSENALLQPGREMVVVGQFENGDFLADCNYRRDENGRLIPPEEQRLPGWPISKGDIGDPTGCRCESLPEEAKRIAMPKGKPRNAWAGEPASRERGRGRGRG